MFERLWKKEETVCSEEQPIDYSAVFYTDRYEKDQYFEWIALVVSDHDDSEKKNFYHLFVTPSGDRMIGINRAGSFHHSFDPTFNEVIIPWHETGDNNYLKNKMTVFKKKHFNNFDEKTNEPVNPEPAIQNVAYPGVTLTG